MNAIEAILLVLVIAIIGAVIYKQTREAKVGDDEGDAPAAPRENATRKAVK